jgi:hypothetical protein
VGEVVATNWFCFFLLAEAFAWDMCQSRIAGLEAKEAVDALKERLFGFVMF